MLSTRPAVRPRAATIVALALLAACGEKGPPETVTGTAPDSFRVALETNKGRIVVEAIRAWAPNGVDRFYALTKNHVLDDSRFFRVVPGYIAQFGLNDNPVVNDRWEKRPIPDDPLKQTNARGTIDFTTTGPNSRAQQLFFNLKDNPKLDPQGFAPIGRVVEGMAVLDSLNDEYGDAPQQNLIRTLGNKYLARMFPNLDYIRTARIVGDSTRR